ncbi:hypothetical protein BH09BAC6_BH09BAC6_32550 [soil metagenome]|jgi:hypothetical protein
MNNFNPDTELEYELQELYILCKHWLQDISFMEDETQFFKNILNKYQAANLTNDQSSKNAEFHQKVQDQEKRLDTLKTKIPAFLSFLEPFIGNHKKDMNLGLLEKYNALEAELKTLFATTKATKKELFRYAESIMVINKSQQV